MVARIEKALSAHTVVKVITINVYGVAHMTLMFVKAVMNVFITLKKQVKRRNIINVFNHLFFNSKIEIGVGDKIYISFDKDTLIQISSSYLNTNSSNFLNINIRSTLFTVS